MISRESKLSCIAWELYAKRYDSLMPEEQERVEKLIDEREKQRLPVAQNGCAHGDVSPHARPYKADVDDDSETLCACCENCQNECAADI